MVEQRVRQLELDLYAEVVARIRPTLLGLRDDLVSQAAAGGQVDLVIYDVFYAFPAHLPAHHPLEVWTAIVADRTGSYAGPREHLRLDLGQYTLQRVEDGLDVAVALQEADQVSVADRIASHPRCRLSVDAIWP